MSDVHIINKKTQKGTISNDKGWFDISAIMGDSLQFSRIKIKSKQFIITKENFTERNIKIVLEENTYSLDSFTLKNPKSIFYIDPQILKSLTVNAKPKINNSVINFKSNAAISIDNLISSLNVKKN
jgi:hypothetical protein